MSTMRSASKQQSFAEYKRERKNGAQITERGTTQKTYRSVQWDGLANYILHHFQM